MKERLTKRCVAGKNESFIEGTKYVKPLSWSGDILHCLAEYEDLEEQGLMVRLPCKMGSYIYRIIIGDKRKKDPDKCKVVGMWLSEDEKCSQVHLYCFKNKENWYSIALPLSEFGKTLFTEKEEAEKKLKELNFNEWKRQNGYKDQDEETLRLIFDAMDEDDKELKGEK